MRRRGERGRIRTGEGGNEKERKNNKKSAKQCQKL